MLTTNQNYLSFIPTIQSNEVGYLPCSNKLQKSYFTRIEDFLDDLDYLNSHHKVIYSAISRQCSLQKSQWAQINEEYFVKKTGTSKRTVIRLLKQLEGWKLIFIRRLKVGGKNVPNMYAINTEYANQLLEQYNANYMSRHTDNTLVVPHAKLAHGETTPKSTDNAMSTNDLEPIRQQSYHVPNWHTKETKETINKQYSNTTNTHNQNNTVQYGFSSNDNFILATPNQQAKKIHLVGVPDNIELNELENTNIVSIPNNSNVVKDNCMESKEQLDTTNCKVSLTEEQQSVFDTIASILKSGHIDVYKYKNNRRTGKADKDTLAEYVTKYDHDFLVEVAKYTIKKGTSFNYFISVVESNKDMTSDAFRESTKTKEERQQEAKQQQAQQVEQEQARLFQYALLSDMEVDRLCGNGIISLIEKQQIDQLKLLGGIL